MDKKDKITFRGTISSEGPFMSADDPAKTIRYSKVYIWIEEEGKPQSEWISSLAVSIEDDFEEAFRIATKDLLTKLAAKSAASQINKLVPQLAQNKERNIDSKPNS